MPPRKKKPAIPPPVGLESPIAMQMRMEEAGGVPLTKAGHLEVLHEAARLTERIAELERENDRLRVEKGGLENKVEKFEEAAQERVDDDAKRPDASNLEHVIAVARHVHRETTPNSFDLLSYEEQEQKYAEARAALEFRWP